jgi:hypothetical protein
VIIRISNEGQYSVEESAVAQLNELDNAAVDACTVNDEEAFHAVYGRLLDYVRSNGTPVPDDSLVGSDLILPPADVSLEEARSDFSGEGLIPG